MTRHEEIWRGLALGYLRRAHEELGKLVEVLERLERVDAVIEVMKEDAAYGGGKDGDG